MLIKKFTISTMESTDTLLLTGVHLVTMEHVYCISVPTSGLVSRFSYASMEKV